MKIARFNGGRIGIVTGDRIVDVSERAASIRPSGRRSASTGVDRGTSTSCARRSKRAATGTGRAADGVRSKRRSRGRTSCSPCRTTFARPQRRDDDERFRHRRQQLAGRRSGIFHEVEQLADRAARDDRHSGSCRAANFITSANWRRSSANRRQRHRGRQCARSHLRLRVFDRRDDARQGRTRHAQIVRLVLSGRSVDHDRRRSRARPTTSSCGCG